MQMQDLRALGQGFDQIVKPFDKGANGFFTANPVDDGLHQDCGRVFFGS